METNEVLDKLPKHLMSLIIDQPYNEYTPQDQAVWRYVFKENLNYLINMAHESYLAGLKKTGMNIEEIPYLYGTNRILKDTGWAAVAVNAFIPPEVYLEFLAHKTLPVSVEIRPVSQIGHTIIPDIIQQSAGYTPLIAGQEYAAYLKLLGETGSKAFASSKDNKINEAILNLSTLRANNKTPSSLIKKAETELMKTEQIAGEASEMALIRNLHWWTVEYGLIGDFKKPKIYGARLLSSISESKYALSQKVKKLPLTMETAGYNFSISKQQVENQLFVSPNFKNLTTVLNELAKNMAFHKGGLSGVEKAIFSENLGTVVLSSGIQISGRFSEVIAHKGKPVYIKTTGPTALSFENRQLSGHGKHIHRDGFGTPTGKLKGTAKPLEAYNHSDLLLSGFHEGGESIMEFESGITVNGIMEQVLRKNGKIVLITFSNCTVLYRNKILFQPEWGIYDLAVGETVVSAFQGVADPENYRLRIPISVVKPQRSVLSGKTKKLHQLYQSVRTIRQTGTNIDSLEDIWNNLKSNCPADWLLANEIYELTSGNNEFSKLNEELELFLAKLNLKA